MQNVFSITIKIKEFQITQNKFVYKIMLCLELTLA